MNIFFCVLLSLQLLVGVAVCAPYNCVQEYQPSDYANRGGYVPLDCVARPPSTCPRSWKAGVPEGTSAASPLIDTHFITCVEGFSECGYVPINRATGEVEGNSGVTIGAGVDLGSKNADFLSSIGVSSRSIITQLEPYFGLQRNDAACAAIERPLMLTNSDANALTAAIKEESVTNVAAKYNQQRDSDTLPFNSLPRGVRTAIASVLFQYGSETRVRMFWGYVTRNDWKNTIAELRDFNDNYPKRRNKEADILEAAIAQCNRSIDAVFLLDESGSISGTDFQLSLNFIRGVINTFDDSNIGGESGTRFGLSLFSSSYRPVFYLSTYLTKAQYLSAVGNVRKFSGGTNLGSALTQINFDQFTQAAGLRPDERAIPRILIVLTDGKSSDGVARPARMIRDSKVAIYAIGIGSYDIQQLNAMATSTSHVKTLTSFSNLVDFAGTLTAASCHESRELDLQTKITASVKKESFQYYNFEVDIGFNLKVELNDTNGRTLMYASRINPHPYRYDNTFGFSSSSVSRKTLVISPNEPDLAENVRRQSTSQSQVVYISVTADTDTASYVLEGTICDPMVCSEGTNKAASLRMSMAALLLSAAALAISYMLVTNTRI